MAKHTIKIKKYADIIEEWIASAAITPGHLVEVINSAGSPRVRVHATAGGNAIPMFALEDEMQGGGIDDAYTAAYPVQVWIAGRGDEVNALLLDGETVVVGDFLESAGDGTLQKHVADSAGVGTLSLQIVAIAMESVDMSGSSGVDPTGRIKVKIV
jgi:hypothetical protein